MPGQLAGYAPLSRYSSPQRGSQRSEETGILPLGEPVKGIQRHLSRALIINSGLTVVTNRLVEGPCEFRG